MNLTLLIDGSSPVRTVALARGVEVLASTTLKGGRASPWFEAIDTLLRDASLGREAIARLAVCLGPGSYTGIRATLALAQGWHLARATPVAGLSSLDACVRTAWRGGWRGRLATVMDAQRGEFYLAEHDLDATGAREVSPLRIATRGDVESCLQSGARCAGPDDAARGVGGVALVPDAPALAELAALTRAAETIAEVAHLEPLYLRSTTFVKAPPPRAVF